MLLFCFSKYINRTLTDFGYYQLHGIFLFQYSCPIRFKNSFWFILYTDWYASFVYYGLCIFFFLNSKLCPCYVWIFFFFTYLLISRQLWFSFNLLHAIGSWNLTFFLTLWRRERLIPAIYFSIVGNGWRKSTSFAETAIITEYLNNLFIFP